VFVVCLLADGTWAYIPSWMTMREQCADLKMIAAPEISISALRELAEFITSLSCGADAENIRAEGNQKEARHDESRQANAVGSGMGPRGLLGGSANPDTAAGQGIDHQVVTPGNQSEGGDPS
jgi:hypothetical protein